MLHLLSKIKGLICGRETTFQKKSDSPTSCGAIKPIIPIITVAVRNSRVDIEVKNLLKKATALKSKRELHKAIGCLEKADALANRAGIFETKPSGLRIPMYLQLAGRYDEAMTIFSQYLSTDPVDAANIVKHRPIHIRRSSSCQAFSRIYDKMRLVTMRQGMEREAVFFSLVSLAYGFQAVWVSELPHRATFIEASKSRERFMESMTQFKSIYAQPDSLENLYNIFTAYTMQPKKIEPFISCCMSELKLQMDSRFLPELS